MRIHTDNLTKKYQIGPSEISAVNRITLDIKEGEFLAIIHHQDLANLHF